MFVYSFLSILMVVLSTYAIRKQMVVHEIMSRKMITIFNELPEQLGLLDVEIKGTTWQKKSNFELFSAASAVLIDTKVIFLLHMGIFCDPFPFLQNNFPISISIYHAWCMIGCKIKLLSSILSFVHNSLFRLGSMGIGHATQNSWQKLLFLAWDSHSANISQFQWGAPFYVATQMEQW